MAALEGALGEHWGSNKGARGRSNGTKVPALRARSGIAQET